jgi:hypothetical protein
MITEPNRIARSAQMSSDKYIALICFRSAIKSLSIVVLTRFAFVATLAALPAVSFAQVCEDVHGHAGMETRTVRLEAKPDSPAFYFRSEGFVIFISPNVVLESLHSLQRSRPADRLDPLIRARLPLVENQDLFQFELGDWLFWSITQAIVIRAIENGNASITNEGGVWSEEVRIVHDRQPRSSNTVVYDGKKGRSKIIWRLDCIVD